MLTSKYFNLKTPIITGAVSSNNYMILQYGVLVLGIVVQPFFSRYQEMKSWNVGDPWGWLLFSVIVGVIIFPAVYKRAFDQGNPVFVQLCAIFVTGLGWQSLLTTAVKLSPASAVVPG